MVRLLLSRDVDEFLSSLRKSVTAALAEPIPSSAVSFLGSVAADPTGASGRERLLEQRARITSTQLAIRALAEAIGSLPPSPPTFRGRVGRHLVKLANRFTWWQASHTRQLAELLRDVTEELADCIAELAPRQRDFERELTQLRRRIEGLDATGNLASRDLDDLKGRLEGLETVQQQMEEMTNHGSGGAPVRDDESTEDFYFFHQNRFRGSRDLILERLKVYLPLLKEANVGGSERPALDLGCGRGEWLQLLRSERLQGTGVDASAACVRLCRSLDLDAVECEALAYLDRVPEGSLGLVTAFHLIEHLPFPKILRLVRSARRALGPTGLLIIETPNVNNPDVALRDFYLDPTHVSPLPPELMTSVFEFAGFKGIRTLELHPNPHGNPAGRDYSVVGKRS